MQRARGSDGVIVVRKASQGAAQCSGNIKLGLSGMNTRAQVLSNSVLCFQHEASLCSGLRKHQWDTTVRLQAKSVVFMMESINTCVRVFKQRKEKKETNN